MFGQNYAQVGWGIEHRNDSGFAAIAFTYYTDSQYVWITAALLGITGTGEVVYENKMLYGMSSVYPGWANSSVRCTDGGYAIGGSTYGPGGIQRAALIRYDAYGDSLWLREYGDSTEEWIGRQAKQTPDGGYILTGETWNGTDLDGFLIKTDAQGNEEWTQLYGAATLDYLASVDVLPTGGYVAGGFRKLGGTNQMWVIRVSDLGAVVWQQVFGSPFDDANALITTLDDGSIAVASGWGYANGGASLRSYLARLDSNSGSLIWSEQYGSITPDALLFAVKQCSDGTLIAAGNTNHGGYYKGSLLRAGLNGDSIWMYYFQYFDTLMSDGRGSLRDVLQTLDGGFIACGLAHSSFSGNDPPGYTQDVWVIKVDSMGCLEPGCHLMNIQTQITNLRKNLRLWPNPVHGTLHVACDLPSAICEAGPLDLAITSSDGRLIRTLQADLRTGVVDINVSSFPAGLYHLHVLQTAPMVGSASTWVTGGKFVVE